MKHTYTPELGQKICKAIATSTDTMSQICAKNLDFPCRQTIWEWRIDIPQFGDLYAKAKQAQADLLIEEIVEISDDSSRDTIIKTNRDGSEYETCNTEYVARSRLRVDTRKWIACKLMPKIYGDKNTDPNSQDAKSLMQLAIDKL